jgi:hypothetical protein
MHESSWLNAVEIGNLRGRVDSVEIRKFRGRLEGEEIGKVTTLICAFVSDRPLGTWTLRMITGKFSGTLVRQICDEHPRSGESDEVYEGMVGALDRHGPMAE